MHNMILLLAALTCIAWQAHAEDLSEVASDIITTTDANTIWFDVFHDLPCGEGPHIVYDMLLVECRSGGWGGGAGIHIGGKTMCHTFVEQQWTDWPRCDGRIMTPVELIVYKLTESQSEEEEE